MTRFRPFAAHLRSALLVVLLTLAAAPAAGTDAGSSLAWNQPLQRVADNLTGPTAKAILMIGIFAGGVVLAFGGWESGGRKLAAVVVAAAIVVTGAAFLAQLGITTTVV